MASKPVPRTSSELKLGLASGIVFPSTVYTDVVDIDTNLGAAARITFDRFITESFSMGLYANAISTTTESDADASVFGIGLAFKTGFQLNETLRMRLGLGFGYQMSTAGSIDDVAGLDVTPIVDVIGRLNASSSFIVTLMGFSQPAGGNEDFEVTWYPIPTLLVGIEWTL